MVGSAFDLFDFTADSQIFSKDSAVSLYFHIPFCRKKCPYCHFYVIPDKMRFQEILTDSISLEWDQKLPLLQNRKIASIYFGGGTPTLFAPDGIKRILEKVQALTWEPNCEITIEANPEESSQKLFETLKTLGVNRLSLGVQSLDDRSLTILERGHAAKKAKEAIFEAHHAKFQNISIDLMYDLPDQMESSWRYTLDSIEDLPIQHVSLYNLTIEPHTSFYKKRNSLHLPTPEISLTLLQTAIQKLEKIGFSRYEISAFAKSGYQSRHNKGYWTGRPFLGLGPSAFSYWNGERFCNIANLQRYARSLREKKSPIDFREKLPYPQNLKELLAIHLRLLEGVDLHQYGPLPEETNKTLNQWIAEDCLIRNNQVLRLTERGTLFYDAIAADII